MKLDALHTECRDHVGVHLDICLASPVDIHVESDSVRCPSGQNAIVQDLAASNIPSVFVVLAFDNLSGTGPRSILVKWSVFKGPGSIVLNMGSTTSLIILLPAAFIFGHI
jgi:hypothetical protein